MNFIKRWFAKKNIDPYPGRMLTSESAHKIASEKDFRCTDSIIADVFDRIRSAAFNGEFVLEFLKPEKDGYTENQISIAENRLKMIACELGYVFEIKEHSWTISWKNGVKP